MKLITQTLQTQIEAYNPQAVCICNKKKSLLKPSSKLHVFSGDSAMDAANTGADELVIEGGGNAGLSIHTPNSNTGMIAFSRLGQTASGRIIYTHVN